MTSPAGNPIRVLIVDDSALIRSLLTRILNEDPEIEVVGSAPDPYAARDAIKKLSPDVLTLDVEMPRMDGLAFLRNLMRLHPMPVVMVSSLTEAGAEVTLQALDIGAVDFVAKPKSDITGGLSAYSEVICEKVRMAARARVWARSPRNDQGATKRLGSAAHVKGKILAIGASTGGTEAIKAVLTEFPEDAPPTVVTQHIPADFSQPFVDRVNKLSAITVKTAEEGEILTPGTAYFPPGGRHLRVDMRGYRAYCRIEDGELVSGHKPSVDALFLSLAESAGDRVAAALLTGMGADGAQGMLKIREAGGHTIAQDEATSVVWGMPGSAVKLNAAEKVLPLPKVAYALLTAFD